jgi:hypothetical protein
VFEALCFPQKLEKKLKKVLVLALLFASKGVFAQCFDSTIQSPSPFMGNNEEVFKLSDGSLWEVKYEYEYLYEYYPNVTICPDEGFMIIGGKKLNIASLGKEQNTGKQTPRGQYLETRIDGEFNGFEGETILKLANGQIWQQSEYWYHYHYAYSPQVIIFQTNGQYKIQVDGVDKSVGVTRLK